MGDASAESYEHTMNGLDALLISGAPFAAKRDGFGFEDRMERLEPMVMTMEMVRLIMLVMTMVTKRTMVVTLLV